MTDKEKQEREDLKFEIKARKELLKRLEYPIKLIKDAAQKEYDKRQARIEKNREFATWEEAHEAYGYGYLTEEEFRAISDAFELGQEYVDNTTTPVEAASRMLLEFSGRLRREIASMDFELLPAEEQERIRKDTEEKKKKRGQRYNV